MWNAFDYKIKHSCVVRFHVHMYRCRLALVRWKLCKHFFFSLLYTFKGTSKRFRIKLQKFVPLYSLRLKAFRWSSVYSSHGDYPPNPYAGGVRIKITAGKTWNIFLFRMNGKSYRHSQQKFVHTNEDTSNFIALPRAWQNRKLLLCKRNAQELIK